MITSKNCLQKCNDFVQAQDGNESYLLHMAGAWHTVYNWCSENMGEDFHINSETGIEAVIQALEQLKQKADAAQQQNENQ